MDFKPIRPAKKALNKSYLRRPVERKELLRFQAALNRLFDHLDESEYEENFKTPFGEFLNEAFYRERNAINTRGRVDLAIYGGTNPGDKPQVLFEVKRPSNTQEMFSDANPNAKALHEIILYYLRERFEGKNLELKHLAITNVHELYIFDARDFEAAFAKSRSLVRAYEDRERGTGLALGTVDFYSEIAKPYVQNAQGSIEYIHLSLLDIDRASRRPDFDLAELIAPYKLLSPPHLLKEPFQNDSNSLDKAFYAELLYLLGLEEHREGSKFIIRRPDPGERIPGSFLELATEKLELSGAQARLPERERYGSNEEEISFAVVLELILLWINRLLFMKLLEAQILEHHAGDTSYRFLSKESLPDFEALHELFFGVLAKRPGERSERLTERFSRVPYLNSSLFEESELEQILSIDRLNSRIPFRVFGRTVLKDIRGARVTGELPVLEYLLAFLDAYDFSAEGEGAAVERGKTLINASVLGLIFEKINGYKEGSFYTPGYVTQYMAKKTVEEVILRKFSLLRGKKYDDLESLSNDLGTSSAEISEANAVFDSIRIVDTAVGSGHFLVSVLNELIAAKSELGILADKNGKRIKGVQALVENDELFLIDEEDASFATYRVPFAKNERQRQRETLFEEKRRLIESCLFGVDLNRNSVQICKLRLWIELLKSAYYTEASGYTELETLPNIDVNIKRGNSLVARYPLDLDLTDPLKKKGWSVARWMATVRAYQNAATKSEKREAEAVMAEIRSALSGAAYDATPDRLRLRPLKGELTHLEAPDLIARTEKNTKNEARIEKLRLQIAEIEERLKIDEENPIFREALEWRYEFPEVLDKDGNFFGFDAVIGNPPYIKTQELQAYQPKNAEFYKKSYETATSGNYDIYVLFIERAISLLNVSGVMSYICPHKFFSSNYGLKTRELLSKDRLVSRIVFFGTNQVFENATTYTCLIFLDKEAHKHFQYHAFSSNEILASALTSELPFLSMSIETLSKDPWILANEKSSELGEVSGTKTLEEITTNIFQGPKAGADPVFILSVLSNTGSVTICKSKSLDKQVQLETAILYKYVKGKCIRRYRIEKGDEVIIFPYSDGQLITEKKLHDHYPLTYAYLSEKTNKDVLIAREEGRFSKIWWSYSRPQNMRVLFEKKLLTPFNAFNASYSYDDIGDFIFSAGVSGAYGIIIDANYPVSYEYLLGILNSALLDKQLKMISTALRGDYYSYENKYIKQLPIYIPDPSNKVKYAVCYRIEEMVKKIIELYRSTGEQNLKDAQFLERKIDEMVMSLYR